jgi:hypothetical protein
MEVVHERCCGLDVHKKTVVACAITPEGKRTRTFWTMTEDLQQLARWLDQLGILPVAMESTGVYLSGSRAGNAARWSANTRIANSPRGMSRTGRSASECLLKEAFQRYL